MAKGKFTPSEQRPLVNNVNGEPPSGMFSYGSVVGMILYLSGHIHLYIYFNFNLCARYMCCPNIFHELALKGLVQ